MENIARKLLLFFHSWAQTVSVDEIENDAQRVFRDFLDVLGDETLKIVASGGGVINDSALADEITRREFGRFPSPTPTTPTPATVEKTPPPEAQSEVSSWRKTHCQNS